MIEVMKAITVWQPWASLIAIGAKGFETRGWATDYRGPIAIHAAAKDPDSATTGILSDDVITMLKALGMSPGQYGPKMFASLPRGAIIATAELVGCWKIWAGWRVGLPGVPCIDQPNQWRAIIEPEYTFGDWTPGRYAWELAKVKMLDTPIPAKGMQRLWDWKVAA